MKTKTESPSKSHPIRGIRRAAVSLCGFETADPAATVAGIRLAVENGKAVPMASWDCSRGLSPLNEQGQALLTAVGNPGPEVPVDAILAALAKVDTTDAVLFAHNLHRFMGSDYVVQAVWNLRDAWKEKRNVLVMMAPAFNLPPELQQDVVIVSEAAPTEADILDTASSIAAAAPDIEEYDERKVVDATLGYLSSFAVEQSLALSLERNQNKRLHFNLKKLWELKVQNLKATAGLEVMLPQETFDDLVGCDGFKDLIGKFLNGREQPRAVLHLDEIEKMTAGATGGDLSGTSQALMEQFLYWTELRHVNGVLLVGVPGAGKTRAVTCTAGQAKVPHLRASMSTVKGGIVGESEANMKKLLKCVDAVSQGRTLMIATCNSVDALSPELMARFKLATFVFDYPTEAEAVSIWKYYKKKYMLDDQMPKNTKNWVGREIESCCERAWLFNCSLEEAAKSVVPICSSNAAKMNALRQSVSGRFLSASRMETYNFNPNVQSQEKPQPVRKLQ
ncbi:MAG: ATP-binding protein [Patescibacteria group bacterium]|nr:ATP-binding protein [Patescibacteria group bacterium]